MNPDPILPHPDVLGILREMAAEPGSNLLRVPARPVARTFSSSHAEVVGSESWLTRAERHLLAVYREEAAFALRQAAWRSLALGLDAGVRVHRTVTPDLVVELPSADQARASASRALGAGQAVQFEPGTVELLESLVERSTSSSVSPTKLLRAAHRLVPSERGRILAGSAFMLEHRPSEARECFEVAIRSRLPSEFAAVAWNNLADVLDAVDRPDLALRAADRATQLLGAFLFAEAARLWAAIRLEDKDTARSAAKQLDLICASSPSISVELEIAWRTQRAPRAAQFHVGQRQTMEMIQRACGMPVRRLIDAVA